MQFSATVEVKPMLAAMRRATTLISRSTIPVLTYVRLDGAKNQLTVSGTNLDCWIASTIEAPGASGGVLVPAKDLESALNVLPAGAQAQFTIDGTRLKLVSGRARFEFPTLPLADWPVGAEPEKPVTLRLPVKDLIGSLDALREAVSTDSNRYHLTGIYFDFGKGRLVATNGFILGWEPGPWSADEAAAAKSFILPSDTVQPLKKLLEEAEECDMEIDHDARRLAVSHGGNRIVTKLIDGQFPEYERAVPAQHEMAYRAERDDVTATLARTTIMSDIKTRAVALTFADGELTIKAHDQDGGMAEDTCGARLISGSGDLEIKLSSRQMKWCFDSLPVTDAIDFQCIGPRHAVCVVANTDHARQHLRVIMPLS